ncbi:hypothetical protein BWI17_02525 [Betaproteobacteria bacterium GR16-43]|nr:hypothetical protein BWI17_02525 [Betaproteobacteria bacterium GR16-43]
MRKMILTTLVASAMLATAAAKPVLADTDIYLNFGPPAVRYETVPAPRVGYVWAPGYWDYRGSRHVWVNGHYIRARPGYVYAPPTWRQDNGRWHLQHERWTPDRVAHSRYGDRDHDGIPDYADRDRDNDGVRNSRDAAPDNPYRR